MIKRSENLMCEKDCFNVSRETLSSYFNEKGKKWEE